LLLLHTAPVWTVGMTPLTFRYDVFIRPTSISIKRHVLGRTPLSPVYATYNGPTPALASRLGHRLYCVAGGR